MKSPAHLLIALFCLLIALAACGKVPPAANESAPTQARPSSSGSMEAEKDDDDSDDGLEEVKGEENSPARPSAPVLKDRDSDRKGAGAGKARPAARPPSEKGSGSDYREEFGVEGKEDSEKGVPKKKYREEFGVE